MSEKKEIAIMGYKQPEYFKSFKCVGGVCPASCCVGWKIDWTAASVEKLKKANVSNKLAEIINTKFAEYEGYYIIALDQNGRCPFLTEDNLCLIQRELGEEYLSPTCTTYPRNSYFAGNHITRTCNASCYEVLNHIFNEENAMKLVHYIPYGKQYNRYSIVNAPYTQELLQKCPEYAYHSNIFEFIYELISDTDRDVETSIILGAVAAQKITDYINKEKYTEIPDLLTALKSELRSASIIESIDKIKPVPEIRIGVQARIFDAVTDSTYMTDKVKSGMLNISVFEKGFANYQKVFSGRTFAYRNLVLNTLIDIGFPFACQKYSVFEYYCYFTAVVSSVKLISALIFKDSTEYEHEYKLAIAKLYRKMAHNLSSTPKTMKILKEYNCKSPAYLAVIIK